MKQQTPMVFEGVERVPLKEFTEKAYLDYSMYVILDRALPHIGDGLKPVQRRIIYAMSELGLKASAKYKKSARTVGDVLGKYHPHGDMACYEAMVLMAQPFSFRYPIVDGQGNWGVLDDPKSFAAMRYTEARLTTYAEILLMELGEATVDWMPNFDGTLEEPKVLPAIVPNVLLNGATGIAVGMATDIPPHNLKEVVSACIHLLEDPKADLKAICQHIKAPDFPSDAEIITPKSEIQDIYKTGAGSLKLRAVYTKEEEEIIITALPYQVSGAKVLEQIAQQMQAKKLPMVVDLRDESDHENPTRLIIVQRSNRVDTDALMAHLFATTDLERSYRINLNIIGLDGRPRLHSLLDILKEWLEFRFSTVKRRLQHRLDKVSTRLHILEGYLIAFLNIDEVIKIIREQEKPKPVLMKRFKLTDEQAEAILELKLRHLARLEETKIKGEANELEQERDALEKTLSSKQRMQTLIKKELLAAAEKYGDRRRSPLVKRTEAQAMKETELMPTEPMTVVLSAKGWIRAAKGHEVDVVNLSYKSGDEYFAAVKGRSNQQAIFLDTTGRSYSLSIHTLPSARGQGEPLTGRLTSPPGAHFVGVLVEEAEQHCVLASDAGYGFVAPINELLCKNRSGKIALKVPEQCLALPPVLVHSIETELLATVTTDGHLLIFPIKDLPTMNRGKGNKIIQIPSARIKDRSEYVAAMTVLKPGQHLVVVAGSKKLTLKDKELQHYHGERAKRGLKLPRNFQRATALYGEDV